MSLPMWSVTLCSVYADVIYFTHFNVYADIVPMLFMTGHDL